ncbi:MAG: hypothetical protein MUE44_02075 [Oscillatoriaceae cyanobacterium Prado104]|jgi:hypothetical protein|nr:hypothetical protein [Oscillatoriaceae cyanobacterium Prado104]
MDNRAKIYTLYFVLTDTVNSIADTVKHKQDLIEKYEAVSFFDKFLSQGKAQYSDLMYDIVAEIGISHEKAQQEYGRIARRIESFLGSLRDGQNVGLIFALWTGLELALSFYASICETPAGLVYNLEERLRLEHQKYLSLSQSNSETWQNTDSIIKSKLGNF